MFVFFVSLIFIFGAKKKIKREKSVLSKESEGETKRLTRCTNNFYLRCCCKHKRRFVSPSLSEFSSPAPAHPPLVSPGKTKKIDRNSSKKTVGNTEENI